MSFLFILLDILMGYFLFKEINRNTYFGNLILKVKFDRTSYLFLIGWLIVGSGFIYLMIKDINDFIVIIGYNKELFRDNIVRNISMTLLSILSIIRQLKSREIRERGISTARLGLISFNDIKEIKWVNENLLEIYFIEQIFHRKIRERWKVKND